ncbi:hypothetical protein NMG46_24075 [Mesorhizobium sp. LMG 17147]|uniref:hypothetical protein n=1 Tax=Mesorhizobium sp. LMG 17147 TaxID=2963091 RepID=UPI0020C9D893|nr:hypothetical protein [Mesorhizobium sp. LMG 17147]MCP9233283.1 hypothetical protein [Mesorhizobium sp. LMG 17147]
MEKRPVLTDDAIMTKKIDRRDLMRVASAVALTTSGLVLQSPSPASASHTNDPDVRDAHQRITITSTTTKIITTTDTTEATEKTNKDKDVPKKEDDEVSN